MKIFLRNTSHSLAKQLIGESSMLRVLSISCITYAPHLIYACLPYGFESIPFKALHLIKTVKTTFEGCKYCHPNIHPIN